MFLRSIEKRNGESGIVLIVCLVILLMLSLIGIASITTSNTDLELAGNEMDKTGSFYAAEAGLEKAMSALVTSYQTTGAPPYPLPYEFLTMEGYSYYYWAEDNGPAAMKVLDVGSYTGLYGLAKTFEVSSLGYDNDYEIGVRLEQGLEDAVIPLFQFAIFYEGNLEFSPGPDMVMDGRVHANGDVYLQSSTNLYLNSRLTSGGSLFHGDMPASGFGTLSGNVFISDDAGTYQNMRNIDGTFLDSDDPSWITESLSRWGGQVEDVNHGITDLNMQVVASGNSTDLIDRGDQSVDSYEHDAGLRFVDGQALYRNFDGSWLDVTAAWTGAGVITPGAFQDQRESQSVQSLDIDMDLLNASGYFPPNGVIYASLPASGTLNGVRLINGSALNSGLTIATNNPIYVQGDYNTINQQPAALVSDAITVLSNNWDDGNSGLGLPNRMATQTTINASVVTGIVPSANGNYSGGFENLIRYMEDWSGIDFNWKGSAISLWESRQATSQWNNRYYSAPNRNFVFDRSLLDPLGLPPEAPKVNVVLRTSWNQTILYDYRRYYEQLEHGLPEIGDTIP